MFNGPKLNLFDCLIIGPITVDVIHLNHSLKIRFREGRPIQYEPSCRPWVPLPEDLTLNLEKKRKNEQASDSDRQTGYRERKKKENYQKDKKGLCFKLTYIFTFKLEQKIFMINISEKYRECNFNVTGTVLKLVFLSIRSEHFKGRTLSRF